MTFPLPEKVFCLLLLQGRCQSEHIKKEDYDVNTLNYSIHTGLSVETRKVMVVRSFSYFKDEVCPFVSIHLSNLETEILPWVYC